MTEPTLPFERDGREFSAGRRRIDGSHSVWATSTVEAECRLTRWDLVENVWALVSRTAAPTWVEVVAPDGLLVGMRPDELTNFAAPDVAALLDLLTVEGTGDPEDHEWPFDIEAWEEEDEDFRFEDGQSRRYSRVNDQRIHFVDAADSAVAILAEQGDVGDQIAELIWNNGGDPASVGLYESRAGATVGLQRGESIYQVRVFRYDGTTSSVAMMVGQWLDFAAPFGTAGGAAAIALEDFDPQSMLTSEQRKAWDDVLREQQEGSDYTFRVWFDVPAAVKDELRSLYSDSDDGYDAVRDAFANPIEGDWLREQLDEGITESLW